MKTVPQARTVGFRPGERNVFFHILTACNLRCRHCYINPAEHGSHTLPLETVRSWLALFARPGQRSNLILLGGEPTLHPDLAAIIRAARAMRFTVTVDSNGYLFHDLLTKTTPQELDCLSFSLDGPDATVNDAIRGEGSFRICTNNIRKAVAAGFTTSLIYTVSSLNIHGLPRMPALLEELGVHRFFIQVIGLRGTPAATDAGPGQGWQLGAAEWRTVVPQVAAEAAGRGIHVTYPKVYLDAADSFECAGLIAENYFIFPNGRIYRCPLCEDHPIHSHCIEHGRLVQRPGLTEASFFPLRIPEGCVMNRLLQPDTISYHADGSPQFRISCCLLKEEIVPSP